MIGQSEKNGTPIVEHKPNEIEPSDLPLTLERRIRQQEILAELGVSALLASRGATPGPRRNCTQQPRQVGTEKRPSGRTKKLTGKKEAYAARGLSLNPTPRRGVHRFQTDRGHLNPEADK